MKKYKHLLKLWVAGLTLFLSLAITDRLLSSGEKERASVDSGCTQEPAYRPFKFEEDLFPSQEEVDVNIGTNFSPIQSQDGRYRILVDPLFPVCEQLSQLGVKESDSGVTAFCMAVSNFTGFATFREYNERKGLSSSLARVSTGSSHERFDVISKRTVLVLEASVLFDQIFSRGNVIHRLKIDVQGYELTVLQNIMPLLREKEIHHVKAECDCIKNGKQLYEIDNSCAKVSSLLQVAGFKIKYDCASGLEQSDVYGYKSPASEFVDF